MTIRSAFSADDIRQLLRGPTDDDRAAVAHRLCRRIDGELDEVERVAATEVLRLMAADAAEVVRRALAVTLRASPHLPRDVALRLAADVDTIAAPVLNFSPAFTDADLCEIVRLTGAEGGERQLAVARRAALSETVAGAMALHGSRESVSVALANDNADFSERALRTSLDRFGGSVDITAGMAYRRTLPLSISERLVKLVGDEVRRHLVVRHGLSLETAQAIGLEAQERATADLVEEAGRAPDTPAFVAHLHAEGRLTPSLVLRILAHGDMGFVEHALAALAGLPHHRAWLLIHDAGPLGLQAICDKAGVAPGLRAALRAGIDTFRALQLEDAGVAGFQMRMLERFLTAAEAPQEDIDYLVARMDRIAPSIAAIADRRSSVMVIAA